MSRVILLEFNEITPPVLSRFIADGHLPGFRALRDAADVYVTDAEASGADLEPWIQWVTVHTGLAASEHGVRQLDEGPDVAAQSIWDVAADHGRDSWLCAAMNVSWQGPPRGATLPDPWSTRVSAHPAELEPLFRFVQASVREHTAGEPQLSRKDYLRAALFLARRGVSRHTIETTARQLLRERGGRYGWKRVAVLDRLLWDVFCWYHRRQKPALSVYFANSTAHLQHRFWRNMDPAPFCARPSAAEQAEYGDAILFGYQQMDRLVTETLALAGDDTSIVLASALSQQPCLDYEATGGKRFYRPHDFDAVLDFADIARPRAVAPVMSEQFHVRVDDAARAVERLRALVGGERPVVFAHAEEDGDVMAGCARYDVVDPEMPVRNHAGREIRFGDLFYAADSVKSGKHHPDGVLWVKNGRKRGAAGERVSLRAVAPTVLRLLGCQIPATMREGPLV